MNLNILKVFIETNIERLKYEIDEDNKIPETAWEDGYFSGLYEEMIYYKDMLDELNKHV